MQRKCQTKRKSGYQNFSNVPTSPGPPLDERTTSILARLMVSASTFKCGTFCGLSRKREPLQMGVIALKVQNRSWRSLKKNQLSGKDTIFLKNTRKSSGIKTSSTNLALVKYAKTQSFSSDGLTQRLKS